MPKIILFTRIHSASLLHFRLLTDTPVKSFNCAKCYLKKLNLSMCVTYPISVKQFTRRKC